MKIKYENGFEDCVRFHEVLLEPDRVKNRRAFYCSLLSPVALGVLAVGSAFTGPNLFLAFLAILLFISYLQQYLPYSKFRRSLLYAEARTIPTRTLRLEFDDEGLRENSDGIESFCPWEKVIGCFEYCETLFIQLSNGTWSIVPKKSLSGDVDGYRALKKRLEQESISMKRFGDSVLPK